MSLDLLSVEKPARYMGGEMGSVTKSDADLRIALAFPDVYEVGMSHLGLRILYQILNALDGIAAERVYTPGLTWPPRWQQNRYLLPPWKPLPPLQRPILSVLPCSTNSPVPIF